MVANGFRADRSRLPAAAASTRQRFTSPLVSDRGCGATRSSQCPLDR